MHQGMRTFIIPVKDLAGARALYTTLLGVEPYVDQPYYLGFRVGGQEVGLDPNGHNAGMTGPIGYWPVDDIEVSLHALQAAGAVMQQAARDVGGGRLIATVSDADGNAIGLMQEP